MSNILPGLVVAIDGPDGVGKTTQVDLLVKYFETTGRIVYKTRSSGGTPIGEELRKVSLSSLSRPAMTDLYISLAMSEALAQEIMTRKSNGEVVVIDRSPLATLAYNGYGEQLVDIDEVYALIPKMIKQWKIDYLFLLTASTATLNSRRISRNVNDYFELQKSDFHARVRKGYEKGFKFLNDSSLDSCFLTKINSDSSISEIHKAILKQL